MVEGHTAGRQISPMLVGRKLHVAVTNERFQYLYFDQGHLTIGMVLIRVGPESRRVTIAFKPDTGD
jgi:hypothetical protein